MNLVSRIQTVYSSEFFYEEHSKGFVYISGIKRIEHSGYNFEHNYELKEILNSFFCEIQKLIKEFYAIENFFGWRGLELNLA